MADATNELTLLEYDAEVFDVGDELGGPTLADQNGDQTDGMGAL